MAFLPCSVQSVSTISWKEWQATLPFPLYIGVIKFGSEHATLHLRGSFSVPPVGGTQGFPPDYTHTGTYKSEYEYIYPDLTADVFIMIFSKICLSNTAPGSGIEHPIA